MKGELSRVVRVLGLATRHDGRVRIFCLVLPLLARNAWAMMRQDRRAGGDGQRIPRAAFRTLLVPGACDGPGIRLPRKPPP